MEVFKLSIFLIIAFVGYLFGRLGDRYLGHWNTIHHWTYCLAMVFIGYFLSNEWWRAIFIFGGSGGFISDLRDFLEGRIYGPDVTDDHKFWGID